MTVQHQLEVYMENPVNKLCQLSKKGVHVIVSNLLCSCTMDIKGVLDLYYRGQLYVFPEGAAARGCTKTIHTQMSMVQVACTMNTYCN